MIRGNVPATAMLKVSSVASVLQLSPASQLALQLVVVTQRELLTVRILAMIRGNVPATAMLKVSSVTSVLQHSSASQLALQKLNLNLLELEKTVMDLLNLKLSL